jgi:hypothetical protein
MLFLVIINNKNPLMKLNLLFVFAFVTSLSFAQQIPDDIKPPSWSLENLSSITPHKLTSFDLKKLTDEDVINDKDKSKPWRFGHDIYVDHSAKNVGEWTTLPNGDRMWRMTYKSEGAHTLNFMFDIFRIPEGATLYVYNDEKNDLIRPFTHHNNNPEEVLGTWLVKGDQAWIEYYQPARVKGEPKLTIGSVIHGYRTAETYQKALNDSGSCNQDVDCDITPSNDPFNLDTVKENIKKANAMMVSGGGFCSGTLINNTNNDGTPYFMTANHCGGGEGSWAFRFNWRSPDPSCSTNVNSTNGSFDQTVSGAILRANNAQSDMELVEITDTSFFNDNASNLVWAGWNRSKTQVPVVNFGIHHPSGDIQKVCREDDGAYRRDVDFQIPDTKMWYIDQWELGVTEPGSSGSALYNETGHLIGMLSGGAAACSGTSNNGTFDYYGRFDEAWDFGASQSSRLKEWLDPSDSGIEVLDQYPSLETFDIDARVSAGSGNSSELCAEDFSPQVTLLNPGNLALTSADVSYALDSNAPTTVNWTGNLESGESIVLATPSYSNLSPGPHSFSVDVTNPNATTDENTSNDSFVFNFNISPEFSTTTVVFNITTDDYGQETTWELRNSADEIVSSGPSSDYDDNTDYQETITIPEFDTCYTFTIFDDEDDGICCGFGTGFYNLEDENGNAIIDSVGDFGTSETTLFNAQAPLSIDQFSLDKLIDLYPNPVTNNLNISLTNLDEAVSYELFNTLGQLVSKGDLSANSSHVLDLSQQKSGIYFMKLNTDSHTMTKKIVKK